MSYELTVPSAFKNAKPSQAFAALHTGSDDLAAGIGQSYGIVGYKGKTWSLRYRGQRHTFIRPDDGTPASYIDCIITGASPHKSKSYFLTYDPDAEGGAPRCASLDGVTPDEGVPEKQCDTCVACPRNVWKILPTTGRKGKECQDYKRISVFLLPAQTQKMLGAPLQESVFLRVPPASLNALATLGETMTNQGYHHAQYITRISFDPNKPHPEMVFEPLQPLSDAEAPVVLKLVNDPIVARITRGETVISNPSLPAASAPATATVLQAAAATAASPSPTATSVPPATNLTFLPETDTLGEQPVAPVSSSTATSVSGPVAPAPALSLPDTGAAEESDDDLDARLAGLIKTLAG